jgi:hypothetical protein
MKDNAIAWLIQMNGMIVDARHMPREAEDDGGIE